MRTLTFRFTIASALAAVELGVGAGSADAATTSTGNHSRGEAPSSTGFDIRQPVQQHRTEVCGDWTNEDGSYGTKCPSGGRDWLSDGGVTRTRRRRVSATAERSRSRLR